MISERIASSVASAAGVADDVGIAGAQAEDFPDIEPRVHAGEDGQPPERRGGQLRAVEQFGVARVLGEHPSEFAAAVGHPVSGRGRTAASASVRAG